MNTKLEQLKKWIHTQKDLMCVKEKEDSFEIMPMSENPREIQSVFYSTVLIRLVTALQFFDVNWFVWNNTERNNTEKQIVVHVY